jgi:methylmalonyl-CoA mutase
MAEKVNTKLFSEFAPTTTQEWMDKITKDLKGADFNRKLVWRTNEGFDVQPFYRLENMDDLKYLDSYPGDFPYVRGNKKDNNDWFIRQDIVVDDIAKANEKALDILYKGIDSLGFVLNADKEYTKADIEALLKDIALDCIELNFVCGCKSVEILPIIKEIIAERGIDASVVKGGVDIDPLGYLTLKGRYCCEGEESNLFDTVKKVVLSAKELISYKLLEVNGANFNNSGSSIVQELGFSLAAGVEYLTQMTERGLGIDEIAPRIRFHFATGSKYFMEIAKLRAGRYLWSKIVKAYNPSSDAVCKMNVHAETSDWNKTIYDPNVNMLRTQTEAMSAALGGLDSFTVKPYDSIFQNPSDFSERIARNQQILLKEESHFARIADPAGGSYYIEELTQSIIEAAWNLFLEVQEKGGYIAALKEGFIQESIKATAQKRDMAIATRRENLLGTNIFPNFTEKMETPICSCKLEPNDMTEEGATVETLKPYRGAQAFEALRLKTDIFSQQNGRPLVQMFPMGNLNMRKARAQFACNFFACAGFDVADHNGFASVDEGVKVCNDNKAKIVVVCSSDDEYADIAPEVFEKLGKDAIVVIAGAPACAEDLKAKGITNFINVKSNLLEELKRYQAELAI